MIAIIDYRAGNVASLQSMLRKLGHESIVTHDHQAICDADRLILPGVGAFDYGMTQLAELGLVDLLRKLVYEGGKPFLGICLGAQLLTQRSDEGHLPGLGWFDAETVAFDQSRLGPRLRVPHMGWQELRPIQKDHQLFAGSDSEPRFYFVHSYHIVSRHSNDVLATAPHGYDFVAGLAKDHIAGVQFHPEKSHRYGMRLLDNFAKSA